MDEIYFDNAATTRPTPEAVCALTNALVGEYGNASSIHARGKAAKQVLEDARAIVAEALGVDAEEIYFTSGATEANNLALYGAAGAAGPDAGAVVVSALEHPSVTKTVRGLRRSGWKTLHIPAVGGNFDFDALHDALQEPVSLVSVMMVNNELGYIFPIKRIVQAVRERSSSTLVHCDAVQAFGKFEVLPRELGVDLLSVASHKIGGPKGIGALYVKGGTSMHTTAFGGGQERGLRSGTEAPFLAAGFAAAIGVALDRRKESFEHVSMLRDRLVAGLHERFSNVIVNSREDGSPYIVSFAIPGIDRRSLVQDLSDRGIYVSLSSACSYNRHTVPAGTWREKHPLVLELAGVAEAARDSTLRVSFCADNTAEEVDVFLSSLSELCV